MLTKSQLAASIGCGYTIFRRYLRALERGNRHFFTGHKHYVTAQQEAYIRDFFAHLPALESFPQVVVWPRPAAAASRPLPQPTSPPYQ